MAANSQYSSPGPLFAGQRFDSTGTPGSQGISAGETHGEVVGTYEYRNPLDSAQIPGDQVDVTAGDTDGVADDLAVHTGVLNPDAGSQQTGSGTGSVAGPHHPNAGG